ncbi:hypothetical protein ACWKSP_05100 [Micromonosporaceae bacterium Da 78-11]
MHPRDHALTALILGFFASSWFGWAQEKPPARWRKPLAVAAPVSLVVALAGALLAWQNWCGGTVVSEPAALRRYGIIVGLEFGIAAIGAVALLLARQSTYLAPWICLVVGAHFLPLAPVLENPALVGLGVLLVAVAVAGVVVHRRTGLPASAVTGAGAGVSLLAFASWSAVAAVASHRRGLTPPWPHTAVTSGLCGAADGVHCGSGCGRGGGVARRPVAGCRPVHGRRGETCFCAR